MSSEIRYECYAPTDHDCWVEHDREPASREWSPQAFSDLDDVEEVAAETRPTRVAIEPRTELARHVLKLRERSISRGLRLMTRDEIESEIASRRGERS